MGKILATVLLTLVIQFRTQAQITLEHTYSGNASEIVLSAGGDKIMYFDSLNVYLYNMNHTLWKTITPTYYSGYKIQAISVVSDNLFNSDNLVEMIVGYYSSSMGFKGAVINESGSVLFDLGSAYFGSVHYNSADNNYKVFAVSQSPIYPYSNSAIYGVPGTIPCGKCGSLGVAKPGTTDNIQLSEPIPNPSNGEVRISYYLPVTNPVATIVFRNTLGEIVRKFSVSGNSSSLNLNNDTFPSGVYFYNMQADNLTSQTKTMIVK